MNEVTFINGLIVAFATAMVSLPILTAAIGVFYLTAKSEKSNVN